MRKLWLFTQKSNHFLHGGGGWVGGLPLHLEINNNKNWEKKNKLLSTVSTKLTLCKDKGKVQIHFYFLSKTLELAHTKILYCLSKNQETKSGEKLSSKVSQVKNENPLEIYKDLKNVYYKKLKMPLTHKPPKLQQCRLESFQCNFQVPSKGHFYFP